MLIEIGGRGFDLLWDAGCSALALLLLAASKFDSALDVQPDSCISMLKIIYLVLPFVLDAMITLILSRMKVEAANEALRTAAV